MQQKINNPLFFPMLVSEEGTVGKMNPEFSAALWERFHALPQEKQDILTSEEMPVLLRGLQESLRLGDAASGMISLFVRKVLFGEVTLAECKAHIGAMFAATGAGDPNSADAIVDFIEKEILAMRPRQKNEETDEEEQQSKAPTTNLPLLAALTKYEMLGQQVITSEKIKLKTQVEPVRPSLVNWLKYYRDELGVGYHDSVQRGNFLFRSENGRRLSAEGRERVSLILKSIEENFPLAIDTMRQEVIFPAFRGVVADARPEPDIVPVAEPRQDVPRKPLFTPKPLVARPEKPPERAFPDPYENGEMRINRGTNFSLTSPKAPVPAEKSSVSFSTNHILPAEKEVAERRTAPPRSTPPQPAVGQEAPVPSRPVSPPQPQPNPFHIRPVSLGGKEELDA